MFEEAESRCFEKLVYTPKESKAITKWWMERGISAQFVVANEIRMLAEEKHGGPKFSSTTYINLDIDLA